MNENRKGEMLSNMLVLATQSHAGQYDKGGKPYVLHALAVMAGINSDDEELLCIALGHDLIEDTPVTYQQLYDLGMTERVVVGIRAITKQKGQTYNEYRASVLANTDAMRVKMADLRHNSDISRLKGVTEKDIERMKRYHKFYLEIQEKLRVFDKELVE